MIKTCGECCRFEGNGEYIGYPYGECGYCNYKWQDVYSGTLACSAGESESEEEY
jgi:hypothetical protein